jgi:hypothetical protein
MASLRPVASPTADAKEEQKGFGEWVDSLYAVQEVRDEEIEQWYEVYQYKGFDRKQVLKELREKVQDVKIVQQIILVCGMLGPQRAAMVKLMNGREIRSYGIPASGLKGSKGVSCQRITAATADLCAYFLKKVNLPKRLPMNLPGWLQFPSAGSIIMPEDLRIQHIDFSRRFSVVIGGTFNEQIYQQMANNAYLSPNLRLFDDHISPAAIAYLPSTVSAATVPQQRPATGRGKGNEAPRQST